MEMDIKIVKDEIDIPDEFVCNMNVVQEKVTIVNIQNLMENPIKQEINDSNTIQISKEFMISVETERINSDNVNTHLRNKIKNLKAKGMRIKVKGQSLKNRRKKKVSTGIVICEFCGNIYRKQVECEIHFSTNHRIKLKKMNKAKSNNAERSISDTNILKKFGNIKDEIEITEHYLKKELQEYSYNSNVIDNLNICIDEVINNNNFELYHREYINEQFETDKPFHCHICLKSFSKKGHLRIHLHNHTGEKPFKCDICLKHFSLKRYLKRHVLSHTGERSFKCDICSKSFLRNQDLRRHLLCHQGERPFKCSICSKSFVRNDYLETHMAKHSGERPFQCYLCSKSFLRNQDLKRHLLCHGGEKPFKCNICSKSFVRNDFLDTHLSKHSGEKPFKCEICLKSYLRKGDLKKHSLHHCGEKSFKCEICFRSFTQKSNLNSHLRKHLSESQSNMTFY